MLLGEELEEEQQQARGGCGSARRGRKGAFGEGKRGQAAEDGWGLGLGFSPLGTPTTETSDADTGFLWPQTSGPLPKLVVLRHHVMIGCDRFNVRIQRV